MAALVWAFAGAGMVEARPSKRKRADSSAKTAVESATNKVEPTVPPVKQLSPTEVQLLLGALVGTDEDAATAAAIKLGEQGGGNVAAVDALVETLALGTTPSLAVHLLKALGKCKHPKSLQILALFAANRHSEIRVAAIGALEGMREDGAAGVLIERLGDQDASVRAVAASALAARKDTRASARLWALVQKSDVGAGAPFGQLGALDFAAKVAELRGTIDDVTLSNALGEFLKRPDAPDRLRIDLVRTLGRVPGAEATTALVEYLATVPEGEARPSKQEAETLIEQRSR